MFCSHCAQEARAARDEAVKRAEAAVHEVQALREQCKTVEADAKERVERWVPHPVKHMGLFATECRDWNGVSDERF
jgi:hypothetical protein